MQIITSTNDPRIQEPGEQILAIRGEWSLLFQIRQSTRAVFEGMSTVIDGPLTPCPTHEELCLMRKAANAHLAAETPC